MGFLVLVLAFLTGAPNALAQPGSGGNADTSRTALGSLSPIYITNYNVNRLTTDWLQKFDFGANLNFMNFTNKTTFDVHNDDGRDESRRNGSNKLDMRLLMIRRLPVTASFNLNRTSVVRPGDEQEINFGDLSLNTVFNTHFVGARHTINAGGGFNQRAQTSVRNDARSKSTDTGWQGNATWKARWNLRAFTINGNASERRTNKNSKLEEGDSTRATPTNNVARSGQVSVAYDPQNWFSANGSFALTAGNDEFFIVQAGPGGLEKKVNDRRTLTGSMTIKPRRNVNFTLNMATNEHSLGYRLRTDIASSGNGYSWDGILNADLAGFALEGKLASSEDLLDPATSASTETHNNVFDGQLSRPLSSKFSFRLNWLVRTVQVFFDDVPQEQRFDRDELKTKVQPTLVYNPGNKWTVTTSYIRSTNRSVQLNPNRANQTKEDEDFTVDFGIGYTFSDKTRLTQNYSIKALYTTFDFNPSADRLLSTQRIVTAITSQLTPRVYLGMEHRFTLQDSGPFRFEEGSRIFSRSLRKYRQELATEVRYTFTSWATLLANARILRTDDLNEATNVSRVTKNLDNRLGLDLQKTLGRGLSFNASGQYVRSNVQDSFWNLVSSLRKDF